MRTTYIAKAATPEQLQWRRRLASWEPTLVAAFLSWVARLHDEVTENLILHAIVTNSASAITTVMQTVAGFAPDLAKIAGQEGDVALEELGRALNTELRLRFNLQDPNFALQLEQHQAQLVREVTAETRRSIVNAVGRGYRSGIHPDRIAPVIRQTVGLTARQSNTVMTVVEQAVKNGATPEQAAEKASRYAEQLRRRRAVTIARTETARAATLGRIASYEQAANNGLFDTATAELEWSSVQEDPNEICAQLDGTRVPFGQDFDGMLPPAHPCCRCSCFLVV